MAYARQHGGSGGGTCLPGLGLPGGDGGDGDAMCLCLLMVRWRRSGERGEQQGRNSEGGECGGGRGRGRGRGRRSDRVQQGDRWLVAAPGCHTALPLPHTTGLHHPRYKPGVTAGQSTRLHHHVTTEAKPAASTHYAGWPGQVTTRSSSSSPQATTTTGATSETFSSTMTASLSQSTSCMLSSSGGWERLCGHLL